MSESPYEKLESMSYLENLLEKATKLRDISAKTLVNVIFGEFIRKSNEAKRHLS